MVAIAAVWQPHVNYTINLFISDPFPDVILEGFIPRGQIQVKTVEVTKNTIPIIYRIKFVDPESALELEDKKGICPYRILYCVGRKIVYVGAISHKDSDPYSMHNLNGILIGYKEYKKQNRKKKTKRK